MVRQQEALYVNEYLRTFHPTALQWKRTRLGTLPKKELSKLYKVTLRYIDAIFLEDDIVHLLEAKLRDQLKGVAQLEIYLKHFKETPEFMSLWDKKTKAILLVPTEDRDVKLMCAEKNIEYVVYYPDWLKLI